MRQIINLGATAGDKTGTPARSGGRIINENFAELYALIDIIARLDIIEVGTGLLLMGQDLTVNANWVWYINNIMYTNPAAVNITGIPYCAAGKSRFVFVVPNASNGFTLIDGEETTGSPFAPTLPNSGIYATFFTVTDSAITTPEDPNLGGNLANKTDKGGYEGTAQDLSDRIEDLELSGAPIASPTVSGTVKTTATEVDPVVYTKTAADALLAGKLNTADYNDRFKGVFLTEAALNAAHPTASAGDYAQVNVTGSTKVVNYSWDAEDNVWAQGGSGGSAATNTDALPEGTSNFYFTTARVLAATLSGLSLLTGGTIVSADSVLAAFGKLQKQINDAVASIGLKQDALLSGTNIKTINGSSILGSGDIPVQIIITTSVSISNATTDASSNTQHGKNVIIDNGVNAINYTINGAITVSFVKHGTGAITFVQGSGRTLAQVDGTAVLNGAVGSTATISSVGTKDYLRISNA